MKNLPKKIKFPKAKKPKKPEPQVSITVHFGDLNVQSFDLPFKQFRTPRDVRVEVKKRFKTASKAFVTFPGDEFAESMTFSSKVPVPKRKRPLHAQVQRNRAAVLQRHPELATA